MFFFDEDQVEEAPSVPSDPYRSLVGTNVNSPITNGGVFNSYCNNLTPFKGNNHQDHFKNGNTAQPQFSTFGSIGDTTSPWCDNTTTKIPSSDLKDSEHSFYLGGDEEESSEEEFEDEILSLSDEDHVAGFRFDEDSGIGTASNGPSLDEEEIEHPSELVSLPRSLHIGSVGRGKMRAPKAKKQKLQFTDFYKLTDNELGQGAYAMVRTCIEKSTRKEFAVKLVSKHEEGHTKSRILREVEIFKMCKKHPNIVQLIDWFEDDDYFYMVFEKMRGGPLLNHIQAKSCFTEEEASQVTKDIASALKFLHDLGIAHRDVKPENILCTEPDRVSPVKLCDLDLASKPHISKRGLRTNLNSTGGSENAVSKSLPIRYTDPELKSPVGSAEFLAPEVVDTFVGESLKYDKKCDVWALGVVIYVMLCGYPPFYGRCDNENCGWDQGEPCDNCQESLFKRIQRGEFDFPEEDWEEISESAKDLIRHLLVKDVSKRFTADDVLRHPWVMHEAPQTPLQTVNNLIHRKDSARDISMMNENFEIISRFATNTNPTIEEDLSSNECSPPNPTFVKECLFDIDPDEPKDTSNNVNTPTILLPNQQYVNNNFGNYIQSPLINMNGTIICAPPMAPYVQTTNGALIVPQVCNGTTYYTPASIPQWMPNHVQNKQMIHQPRSFEKPRMNNGSSLNGAISKLGLETCQNAMNRQGSSKNIRKQTRETQVNV